MIKRIEEQKANLKAEISEEIDRYFEKFEKGTNGAEFKIDEIEKLMIENKEKMDKIMNKGTSEMTSSIEKEAKKNVKNAGKQ